MLYIIIILLIGYSLFKIYDYLKKILKLKIDKKPNFKKIL